MGEEEGEIEGERISRVRPLPVIRYNRNMVIYHHPLVGVILMVILHFIIIKDYPNLLPSYYPKSIFWVIYPFYGFRRIYVQNSFSLNIPQLHEKKWKCSHFWYPISDRSDDLR